jgi:hypothetical protein
MISRLADPVYCIEQKIAKSRWIFSIKGENGACLEIWRKRHQALRFLCDLL